LNRLYPLVVAILVGLWVSPAAAEPIVTMAYGDVKVVSVSGSTPAPDGHFRLEAGQTLEIGDDAFVCMMDGAIRKRVQGPASLAYGADFGGSTPTRSGDDSPLAALLARKSTSHASGATRGRDGTKPALVRPIEGTRIARLSEIRWTCDSCGPQQVVVRDPETWAPLWSGRAEGSLVYEGPSLAAGEYLLEFGDLYFKLKVAKDGEFASVQRAVEEALEGTDGLSLAEKTSIEAAVWDLGGFPTQALARIETARDLSPDDPVLRALLQSYEGMFAP